MPRAGPPTILFEVFWTQQARERLIEAALEGTDLPAEDYPLYVMIGAEGPWTPTGLAARLEMPLSTVIFRVRRLERRGHAERVKNPDDGRSFLIRLTPEGPKAPRPGAATFRDYAEAVEERLGKKATVMLTAELVELRKASASAQVAPKRGLDCVARPGKRGDGVVRAQVQLHVVLGEDLPDRAFPPEAVGRATPVRPERASSPGQPTTSSPRDGTCTESSSAPCRCGARTRAGAVRGCGRTPCRDGHDAPLSLPS